MSLYENNNKFVGEKFSLDIVGAYVALIRDRFTGGSFDNFPWKYSQDSDKTRIYIEAGSVDTHEQKDARPSIYVDRSSMVFQKMAINNLADKDLKTGKSTFYCVGAGQVSIDCISSNRGESSILGDIVSTHILMSGDIFRSLLHFRDMSPVTLGATQPWEKDDRVFVTRVSSEFTYDITWLQDPLAVRLNRVVTHLSNS